MTAKTALSCSRGKWSFLEYRSAVFYGHDSHFRSFKSALFSKNRGKKPWYFSCKILKVKFEGPGIPSWSQKQLYRALWSCLEERNAIFYGPEVILGPSNWKNISIFVLFFRKIAKKSQKKISSKWVDFFEKSHINFSQTCLQHVRRYPQKV